MDTDLSKVIQASAYLIAGSVIFTGGMLCSFISLAAGGGMLLGIAPLVGMVPIGLYFFGYGIRGMPFLH